MRIRFGDLILTCDFAFCDDNYIIFGTSSKELFRTYYDHRSEARYNLSKLFKDGNLTVFNLREYKRCVESVADIVNWQADGMTFTSIEIYEKEEN